MFSLKNITEDDIEIAVVARDWEEAIRKLAIMPLKRKMINENYIEAMINSIKEYGPYIVLAENVALAHARPEDGAIETGLYFANLAEPVVFGAEDFDPVKLLVLLSAKDNESHIGLLSELAMLLEDRDLINGLVEAKDKETFINILKGGLDEI